MRKVLSILCVLVWSFSGNAQIDTTVMLVSKIDFQPQYQLHDNNEILLMGYTQTIGGAINIPSPTLEFKEGDSVRLNMWNLSQGPPHTIHLHGLDVNQENDGVPALSFAVAHDDTGSYRFKAPHPGTYLYHCHETSVLHVQAGMYGMLIVRPQSEDTLTWENGYSFHKEYAWLFSEVDTNWHHDTIIHHPYDPLATTHTILDYKPQHFLINGKSEQQLANNVEINGSVGETIYLRLANIGNYGVRLTFPASMVTTVISSDGRPLPTPISSGIMEILPGERYGVLLLEDNLEYVNGVTVDYFNLNTGETENTQLPQVSISGHVGLNEQSENSIRIYPNPATNTIHVDGMNGANAELIDMSGKTVLKKKNITGSIQTESLQNGVYILRLTHNQQIITRKLIIRK